MDAWKESKTLEQIPEKAFRNYLIRCHETISRDDPEVARMTPANAADYFPHLQRTRRINITLFNKSPVATGCRIVDLDREGTDHAGEEDRA